MALFLGKQGRVAINTGIFGQRLQELPPTALPVVRRMTLVIALFVLIAASLPHQIYWREEYILMQQSPALLLLLILIYALALILVYMLTLVLIRWVTGPWRKVSDPEGWRPLRKLAALKKSGQ